MVGFYEVKLYHQPAHPDGLVHALPGSRKPDYRRAAEVIEDSVSRQTFTLQHDMLRSRVLPDKISSDAGLPRKASVGVAEVKKTRLPTRCKGERAVCGSEKTPFTALYAL